MYSTYYFQVNELDPLIFGRKERHATGNIQPKPMPHVEQSK